MSQRVRTIIGMIGLTFAQWIDIIQTVGLLGGGMWVAYTYWRFRKGQVSVGIEPAVVLHRDPSTNEPVLLVRLRILNSSNILFRYRRATATLLDASTRTPDGSLQLVPFAEEDPFIPLYADISKDPVRISKGEVFEIADRSGLSLEPGEYADTGLAFVLSQDLGLMALHVMIEGRQGRLGRRSYWWASFFYVDPMELGVPIAPNPARIEA